MEVYEHLGLVNEALGERGRALDAYHRALEVGGHRHVRDRPAADQRGRRAVSAVG